MVCVGEGDDGMDKTKLYHRRKATLGSNFCCHASRIFRNISASNGIYLLLTEYSCDAAILRKSVKAKKGMCCLGNERILSGDYEKKKIRINYDLHYIMARWR